MKQLVLFAALCAAALCGCGPKYNLRVPNDLLQRLPYESRIELLEAENDLAVAIDHRDEAENEVSRTRQALRRAKDRKSAAEDEAADAADKVASEVAQLAMEEAHARVAFLRAQQQVNVRTLEVQELALRCAHARFELARLNVARKAKVEGHERLELPQFEGQVKSCEADVAEQQATMKEQTQVAQTAKDAWDKRKSALARKTFDARASPFVE